MSASFATQASLKTAVQTWMSDYANGYANVRSTFGPVSSWDVSSITSMNGLFSSSGGFNEDISSWDTSSVTDMVDMFWVRPAHASLPVSSWSSTRCLCAAASPRPPASRPACRPYAPPCVTGQGANAFNQPLSFDTSSVTDMSSMFSVRPARASPQMSNWSPCASTLLARPPAHALPPFASHVTP